MVAPNKSTFLAGLVFAALALPIYAGEKLILDVKIIDAQNTEAEYTYVVPGYSTSRSNGSAGCVGVANAVNCSGSTTTTGSSIPARQVSYHVRGATFALQLPDGRIAVVNCEGKRTNRMSDAGKILAGQGNEVTPTFRSCRIPPVENIQAEFDGDKAKLKWSVSLDGKKTASETYKILAVLAKP